MDKFFTIKDLNFKNKIVLVRVDFNVPLNKFGKIQNNKKLRTALPTIKFLIKQNCKIILMSHLGRPSGKNKKKLKMDEIAKALSKLLKKTIYKADDCLGNDIIEFINEMEHKEILLLENLRFHKEEKENKKLFAKKLSKLANIYVNDAFASSHNNHASITSITNYLPSCAGFLLKKEIKQLSKITNNPKKPFIAIIGGAKISTKLRIIKSLLKQVDYLLLGGAMVFTFYKAKGFEIGKSLLEPEFINEAKLLMKNKKLILPTDIVTAKSKNQSAKSTITLANQIPKSEFGLDIGPKSIKLFKIHISSAKTIMWNGPLGLFEIKKFAKATNEIARFLSTQKSKITIIGGGDSTLAIEKLKLENKFTHISTGGGASLKFIELKTLPGIQALIRSKTKFKSKNI